jgi:hypothetical protein
MRTMTLPKTRELTEEQLKEFYRLMTLEHNYNRLARKALNNAMDYLGKCLIECRAKQMEELQRDINTAKAALLDAGYNSNNVEAALDDKDLEIRKFAKILLEQKVMNDE